MITIFNGRRRTLSGDTTDIHAQIDVAMRQHIHLFRNNKDLNAWAVFTVIALHCNADGWSWPSTALLMKETGLHTPEAVSRCIVHLRTIYINGFRLFDHYRERLPDGRYGKSYYHLFPEAGAGAIPSDKLERWNPPPPQPGVAEQGMDQGGVFLSRTSIQEEPDSKKDSMRESLSLSRGVNSEDANTGEVSGESDNGQADNLTSPETEPSYPSGSNGQPSQANASNGQSPKPKRIDPLFEWVARSLHQLDPDKAGHDKDLSKWIGANVAKFVNAEKDHLKQDTPLRIEQRAALVEQLPGFLRFYYEQCPGCSPPSDKKKVAQYVQRWYDAGKPYSTKAVKVQYTAVIDDPYIASIPVT